MATALNIHLVISIMFISQEQLQRQSKGPAKWRSTRFILSYIACGGVALIQVQRVSLSLIIVCMVNHTALHIQRYGLSGLNISDGMMPVNLTANGNTLTSDLSTHTSNTSVDPNSASDDQRCSKRLDHSGVVPNSDEDGPFVYNKETQGLLLAALYIGYAIMQIPGSFVIRRHGVRLSAGCGIAAMSVCHILCHPAALLSPWAMFALRIIMGFCMGTSMGCFYAVWTLWAPRAEQSQLIGITYCGETIASCAVFPLSALLCQYGFLGGWPSVFYTFGGLGLVWSVLWFLLITDSPESHPRISHGELQLIVTTRADITGLGKKDAVMWGSILRSSCFWAVAVGYYGFVWGMFLMLTSLPTFLYETMQLDIESNGLYSMMPYIALFVSMSCTGFIFDEIIKRRLLSSLAVRRLATCLGNIVPAVLLVVMSHLECHQATIVVVLVTLAVGITGLAQTGGFLVNPYDIAPHYAFNIYTICNTIASTSGIVTPYLVAVLTVDQTREQWQLVFYVTAGVYVAGAIVFCLLVKTHVQPWACPATEES